jgi:hypothetical protein
MDKTIEIKFQNELIKLESALIVGKEKDSENTNAMYCGSLNFDELHNALFYVNVTVLKILTGEMGVPLDDCDDFLLSALSEALTRQWNVDNGHAPDVEVSKVTKFRRRY